MVMIQHIKEVTIQEKKFRLLLYSKQKSSGENLGDLKSFAVIGATIADNFELNYHQLDILF